MPMTDDLPPLPVAENVTDWALYNEYEMRDYARLALSPEWLAKRGLRLCKAEPAAWRFRTVLANFESAWTAVTVHPKDFTRGRENEVQIQPLFAAATEDSSAEKT